MRAFDDASKAKRTYPRSSRVTTHAGDDDDDDDDIDDIDDDIDDSDDARAPRARRRDAMRHANAHGAIDALDVIALARVARKGNDDEVVTNVERCRRRSSIGRVIIIRGGVT